MTVISNGKQKLKEKDYPLSCSYCGCSFRAAKSEMEKTNTGFYMVKCPWCGRHSFVSEKDIE